MGSETLVGFPVNAGWELLNALDEANLQIVAAFWMYIKEDEEWRLVLASPLVDSLGPRKVYTELQRLLDSIPEEKREDLALRDIAVTSPNNIEIQNMRSLYGPITEGRGKRVRRVDLASNENFIYRLL